MDKVKEKIESMRIAGSSDAEIARSMGLSRQRIGQIAGTRKTNPIISALSSENERGIINLIKSGETLTDAVRISNVSSGSIRYILSKHGVSYNDYADLRRSKKVERLTNRLKEIFSSRKIDLVPDNLKTTDIISMDRNLYASMMRVGRIQFWRKHLFGNK